MKITKIEAVPLTAPFTYARFPDHPGNGLRHAVWVRIETDLGITGWGECYLGCYAPMVTLACLHRLTRDLLNQRLDNPADLLSRMRFSNRYWAMRGIGAQSTSAIEAALWDIVGQEQGRPVWRLLGAVAPKRVLLYASVGLNRMSPDEILAEARYYSSLGYRAYKMRCGGDPDQIDDRLALDRERIAAAREGLGPDRLLFVDVGVPQRPIAWDQTRVEAYMDICAPLRVRFIEEPAMTYEVNRYRALERLQRVPVAGGESFGCPEEFEPFFEARALNVAQPDAAVVGGPASCLQVCRRANELGIDICLHCWAAGVGVAQNLHAACASPGGVLAMEGSQVIHPLAQEPLREIWNFEDGYLIPPDKPGLGVTISEGFLSQYPFQHDTERDF